VGLENQTIFGANLNVDLSRSTVILDVFGGVFPARWKKAHKAT
jgi:hypothetical protein